MSRFRDLSDAYRMRWKRRRFLFRAFRSRHQLTSLGDRTAAIRRGDILGFSTVRNEMLRLPYFLKHNRRLGVGHFLFVDNDSDDGTADYLCNQADVSVWTTSASYKASRFGVDWLNWLQTKFGTGHWCLTLDADEILVFPHWETRGLGGLASWLESIGRRAFGAVMIDLYPKGRLEDQRYQASQNPLEILNWFDPTPFRMVRQRPMKNLWVQGGARDRVLFSDQPHRAPTLNKIPLVNWRRGDVYMNSTHTMLPPKLNEAYRNFDGDLLLSGALLHTKFLPDVVARSHEEKRRRQHFGDPDRFDRYYDAIIANPDLWYEGSEKYIDWEQLESLGFLSRGNWT